MKYHWVVYVGVFSMVFASLLSTAHANCGTLLDAHDALHIEMDDPAGESNVAAHVCNSCGHHQTHSMAYVADSALNDVFATKETLMWRSDQFMSYQHYPPSRPPKA